MKTIESGLLKTTRFLPLFITQLLGAFNDNVFKNALVILITYQFANSGLLVTLAAGIFILPFLLFSAIAGQLADKYEKSKLISIIKFIEIILMVVASSGFYFHSIPLLMSALFLLGTQASFFGPLKYAILPAHLRENELIAGNGLIEAGTFLAILVGTILGGTLVLHHHGEGIISASICLIAMLGWAASLFIPKTGNSNSALKLNHNFIKETINLIKYSKQHADLFLCILGISWFWVIGATFLAEFPVYVKQILHADVSVITLFLVLFSVGMALGSLLCNSLLKDKIHANYVPLGVLGMTVFIIDLYFASNAIQSLATSGLITINQFLHLANGLRIAFDLVMIAMCGGFYTVPLYALLQHRSDTQHCARVIASNNVMNALFMVVAAVVTLILLKLNFTITQVFLMMGIINALVAVYICKLLPNVLIKGFFKIILKLLYRVEVKGLDNYNNAATPTVIVANHTSFIDALLLAVFLPDQLTFAVNSVTAKKWWVNMFLKFAPTYTLNPTNPMAIKSLIEYVKKTNARCVIFPEGRLTVTGSLMKIYEGPGLVADKSNAAILPIRIDGAQYTPFSRLKGKVRIRLMPKITISILPAQNIDIPSEVKGKQRRQQINFKLYDMMTKLMFESSDCHKTLFTSLLDANETYGPKHIIMEDIAREPLTYRNFITRSFILGEVIARKTVHGENLGVLLPNATSTVATFFALQAFSRVPVMLNYSSGASQVASACKTAQVKTIYTSHQFVKLAKLEEMIAALKAAEINLVYLEDLRAQLGIYNKLKGRLMAQFPRWSYKKINSGKVLSANDSAVILFTSGSEGTPKGVVLSHTNIQANRYQLSACVDFNPSDTIFNALPIFHSFGLTGGTLLPLLSGIKVFFYPSPLHYRIIPELVYDTNATILFGTDTFLSSYGKHAHAYDFYSLRYVFAGAEKLREETHSLWSRKFGVRVFEGYGATETAPVIAANTAMQNKIGTVGRILPGINYRITAVPGVERGGILHISGPNVMKGYLLADRIGSLVPPKDGWYDTGDIVEIDDAGFLTIKGRVKRFAKIAGEMVSLTLVENLIAKLWPDHQHAVVSIPDSRKGEQLVLVTTHPNAKREDILRFAKLNQISEIAIPKKLIHLKKIPLLGTGKTDYAQIKELLNQNSHPSTFVS